MGLFSRKKIISVDSVVYNMAGEEKDRPNYLKSLVVRNVLSETEDSIATTLNNGYLHGPAMKFRSFYRWAKTPGNYDQVGIPAGSIMTGDALDPAATASEIPHAAGEEVWVQKALIDKADPAYWADQWILDHRPNDINTAYTVDFNESSNHITIHFADSTTAVFTPAGFDYQARYVYAYYIKSTGETPGPIVTGSLVHLGEAAFPSVTGWSLEDDTTTTTPVTLTTTTTVLTETLVEYSDATPDDVSSVEDDPVVTTASTSYDVIDKVYKKSTYLGGDDNLHTEVQYKHLFQTASVVTDGPEVTVSDPDVSTEVVDGVTITTTVTVTTTVETQHIVYDRSYRIDTQDVVVREYSPMKVLIYRLGSGNAGLDSLVNETHDFGEFFPFLPFRVANTFLSESFDPPVYQQVKKAYKKATGARLTKLIDDLSHNPNLGDIDNAYVVFGVSLNVQEMACRRYIYKFFENLQASQIGGPDAFNHFLTAQSAQATYMAAWQAWRLRHMSGAGGDLTTDPEPVRPVFPTPQINAIGIRGSSALDMQYDITIQWSYITNGVGSGLGRPGAKKDDVWIDYLGQDVVARQIYANAVFGDEDDEYYKKMRIYWQLETGYTYLDVVGAVHNNFVYQGKHVECEVDDALADVDESKFIIPLHYETWRQTHLVNSSQMATACVFVVFNCYKVVKQKWWQTSIFRILLVVVIAIVSVVFTGGAGIGLLGAHMSVGAALGFSGMTAAIVGSVANALAALVLTTLLDKLTSKLGIIGQILGAVLPMLIGSIAGAFQSGSLALNFGNLLRVDNLLALTSAVGKGLVAMENAETMAIGQEMQDYAKKAQAETKKIQQAYFEKFGYGAGQIDPFMLVDSTGPNGESSDTFLTRTLMTGSEIAEMSRELLYDFPRFSLKLPDAFT
jgi:hypothetical protein